MRKTILDSGDSGTFCQQATLVLGPNFAKKMPFLSAFKYVQKASIH